MGLDYSITCKMEKKYSINNFFQEQQSDYEKLQKKELIALINMAKTVFSSFDIDTILNTLIQNIAIIIKVSRCSVVLISPNKRYGNVVATYENPDIHDLKIELNKYPEIEKVLENKKLLCINDASRDPLMKNVRKELQEIDLYSFMILPLCFDEEILGTLFLRTVRGRKPFTNREKIFCNMSAIAATKALINARLYNSVQDNFRNTVISMAKSLEKRDEYTHGHSEKVSKYSLMIAEKLGLSETDINIIKYASLLHDIGKIGIQDSTLRKQGRLSDEERKEIFNHPKFGVEILSPIAGMERIIPLVLHHHESLNGEGYPDGLKNEDIPLGSRIITITDAYEAMTANRPYRKAFPQKKALGILEECAGSQFDPKLVKIFLEVI